ncbi:MAG: hypothetical protein NZ772_01515, partial [Cyanobacteria bacterium]|nr:hypothetical protein [Cyanobacteriota bacterium]MDW8199795.1 hypothetical protein [Cyanobacteriota bacterium SKYGB_h_bin112]
MTTLRTLNELIDESAARSEELAGHVKLATDRVNNLDQILDQLRNALMTTGQNAQTQFAALTNALDT